LRREQGLRGQGEPTSSAKSKSRLVLQDLMGPESAIPVEMITLSPELALVDTDLAALAREFLQPPPDRLRLRRVFARV
jgi:hypothetical protein